MSTKEKQKYKLKTEILSGLVVAIALMPEVIAFSFVAGVNPIVGIFSTCMMGLVTAVLGGRPAMITGAAGAVAVVYANLVSTNGSEYLFFAVIVMGIFQIIFGLIGVAKFTKLISYPVILGFLNGLAIVILIAQIKMFKHDDLWLRGNELFIMIILTIVAVLITVLLPKVTKVIPSALIAIVVVTILSITLNGYINIYTISDYANGSLKSSLPSIVSPQISINLESLKIVLPYSFAAALVGLIESLLTLNVVDEMTDTKGNEKKEVFAQGFANIITGLFGGMGGCAMIGQTTININSGGRTYISSFVAAFGLLLFVLFFSPLIDIIPLAALVGVMLVVVAKTFAWESVRFKNRFQSKDLFVIFLVTFITVVWQLALAVIIGVIVSSLFFVWEKSENIKVKLLEDTSEYDKYELEGILFFGSVKNLQNEIDLTKTKNIVLDFQKLKIKDSSAVKTLDDINEKITKNSSELKLINVDNESQIKIKRNQKTKLI